MNILLLVIIGISNLIMCLVFWSVIGKIVKYKNGMVLGMHIDRDKLEDPDLLTLVDKYKKKLNFFKLALVFGSIITLVMTWVDISFFIVVYISLLPVYFRILYEGYV